MINYIFLIIIFVIIYCLNKNQENLVPFLLIDKYRKNINQRKPIPTQENPCTYDPFLNFYHYINKQKCCPFSKYKENTLNNIISYNNYYYFLKTSDQQSHNAIVNDLINKKGEFRIQEMYTKDYNLPQLNLVLFRANKRFKKYYPVQILKKCDKNCNANNIPIIKSDISEKSLT